MPKPTIVSDYIGRTYKYTHPKTGHALSITFTPDMVGRPLDEILDEADRRFVEDAEKQLIAKPSLYKYFRAILKKLLHA